LPQTSTKNHPPAQNLSTITEGLENMAFNDVPEVELQHPANNNASTMVAGSSHNLRCASSTQTNGGAPHQLPPRAPLPIQVIQENAELEQIQMEDWEDDAVEEEELARV
jgi:hypothetical protein